MSQCKIESKCEFSEDCKIKDQAEFCGYHRVNDDTPPSIRCPIFPDCFYASICDISSESKNCKELSSPPPPPDNLNSQNEEIIYLEEFKE